MLEKLDRDTELKLISMYKQVENDFAEFPTIKTTEDFFIWRNSIKDDIISKDGVHNKKLRDEIIENTIRGNSSLNLLYSWARCYMMIDKTKARLYMTKAFYGIEGNNKYRVKATFILHNHLTQQGKANTRELFGILYSHNPELNLGVKYTLEQRTINTPYEFEKAIVKEEESEPWPAKLFITLLKAYGIESSDLLEVGRKVEALGNQYIEEIKANYSNNDDSHKEYVKR